MTRDKELKIYELLGVNIYRKYILFNYERILKFIGIKENQINYKIFDFSTENLLEYKNFRKFLAKIHIGSFIFINLLYTTIVLIGNFQSILIGFWVTNNLIDIYSIMTQRYNYIRINNILEKRKKIENKNIENSNIKIINEKLKQSLAIEKNYQIIKPTISSQSQYNKGMLYNEHYGLIIEEKNNLTLKRSR